MNQRLFRRRRILPTLAVFTLAVLPAGLAQEPLDAAGVFEQLKTLEGNWQGEARSLGGATEENVGAQSVKHEFRVSAAGSVVMEIMGPGTEHEMINMFHLDGADLLLTHYCAAGNQPSMRLDRGSSSPTILNFKFAGGTNFDPAVDAHIHDCTISFVDGDNIESEWTSFNRGEKADVMKFTLQRSGADLP